MNDNTIVELLNAEIERTLSEVSQAQTGSDEAKAALTKLGRLHEQRIKELDAELKNNQRIDSDLAKRDELKIREREVDQKLSLMEKEMALKLTQLENEKELKQAELDKKDAELQEAKRGRRWRTFLDLLGISMPILFTAHWMKKGLEFEEDGKIYSSRTSQWVGNLTRLFRKG